MKLSLTVYGTRAEYFNGPFKIDEEINALIKSRNGRKKERKKKQTNNGRNKENKGS
jgi:hypothetical protein